MNGAPFLFSGWLERTTKLEGAEEFFEEVGGDGGAVFGCAADVVDGF
jgi:hypothetical protein